jgi:phospholipase/carboxylesterase
MRAWYDIRDMNLANRADEAGVDVSVQQTEALIAREAERGVPSERVILAGFSQGGAIVLAGGVRHAAKLGGIIALSTYLPIEGSSATVRSAANAALPVFMGHGSFDPVVPQALGLLSRDALVRLGYEVEWHSYPMAHQVCPPEIADLRAWIAKRLAATAG